MEAPEPGEAEGIDRGTGGEGEIGYELVEEWEGTGRLVMDCNALILRTNASTSSFGEAGGISVRMTLTRAFADD